MKANALSRVLEPRDFGGRPAKSKGEHHRKIEKLCKYKPCRLTMSPSQINRDQKHRSRSRNHAARLFMRECGPRGVVRGATSSAHHITASSSMPRYGMALLIGRCRVNNLLTGDACHHRIIAANALRRESPCLYQACCQSGINNRAV